MVGAVHAGGASLQFRAQWVWAHAANCGLGCAGTSNLRDDGTVLPGTSSSCRFFPPYSYRQWYGQSKKVYEPRFTGPALSFSSLLEHISLVAGIWRGFASGHRASSWLFRSRGPTCWVIVVILRVALAPCVNDLLAPDASGGADWWRGAPRRTF